MSFDGLRLIALPAGRCEVDVKMSHHAINVPISAASARMAVNSDKLSRYDIPNGGLSYFAAGTDIKIRVTNPALQIILEVSEMRMQEWMEWTNNGETRPRAFLDWKPDPQADNLARQALRYLAWPQSSNRLGFEAVCMGLADRAFDRFRNEVVSDARTTARRTDIQRAIDCAEAHLHDPSLSVTQMARSAGISASHFTDQFRTAMGETPYGFIMRGRGERAALMLRDKELPVVQIAFRCGFSSQSHLGSVLKRLYGMTPKQIRQLAYISQVIE